MTRGCGPERAENIWERWASYNPGDEDRIWTDHLATRFLTSILNPLVGSQLVGGLGSVGLHVVRKKHIAAVLADCDSWERVVVGKEGPGSKVPGCVTAPDWELSVLPTAQKHPWSPT